jgi:hypothetical protein
MQDLAALGQEGSNVCAGVHRAGKNIRMLVRGLRLVNQSTQNASKSHSFFHGSTRRSWRQGLEVERQVVLDRCARLDGLHFESCADISEGRRSEGQRLRVVLLPPLIFGA